MANAQIANPDSRKSGDLQVLAFFLFYCAGLYFWLRFLGFGSLHFTFEDWPKEGYYIRVMREAILHHQIPFYVNIEFHSTRFMGVPDSTWSPQILLVPFLSDGGFVVLNVCLFYSLGVVGLLRLIKEAQLDFVCGLFLGIILFFGGYMTSRLAAAHFMWAACFLTPWFLLIAHRLGSGAAPKVKDSLGIALLIFVFILDGGFIVATFWLLFWTIYAAFNRRARITIILGLVLGLALSICRLAPTALVLHGYNRDFIGGYPSFSHLLNAFTKDLGYDTPPTVLRDFPLGWWEFDCYIGWPAALWIVGVLGVAIWRRDSIPSSIRVPAIWIALLFLFFISLDSFYLPIKDLGLPLLGSHRVLTRPIFIVFSWCAFAAAKIASKATPTAIISRRLLLVVGPATAVLLWLHGEHWNLARLETSNPPTSYFPGLSDVGNLQPVLVYQPLDRLYKAVTVGSISLTLLLAALLVILAMRFGTYEIPEWNLGTLGFWVKRRISKNDA